MVHSPRDMNASGLWGRGGDGAGDPVQGWEQWKDQREFITPTGPTWGLNPSLPGPGTEFRLHA